MIRVKTNNYEKYTDINQWLELIYLCILGLYLLRVFFDTTLFSLSWPNWYYDFLRISIGAFLIIKIAVNGYKNIKRFLFDIVYLILFFLIYKGTGYMFLLELGFFVLGAKDIPYKKIIRVYLLIGIPVIMVTMMAALTGCIKDLIYFENDMFKHAFGIVYTTDFGAHILFLILAYLAMKDKVPSVFTNIALIFLAYILYRYSGTRCSSGCIILLVIGGLYVKFTDQYVKSKTKFKSGWSKIGLKIINLNDYFFALSVPLFSLLILLSTIYYSSDNSIMNKINAITTGRLKLGNDAVKKYGFSLWGNPFDMIGAGGDVVSRTDYNFVDSSYVMILVRYGVVLFVLTILAFLWLSIRAKKTGKRYLLVILSIVALQSVIEHHMLEIAYNLFNLLIFANLNSSDYSEFSTVNTNWKRIAVKYCLAIGAVLILFTNRYRFLAYGRTFVTLLNLSKAGRNIYFIMAVLIGATACILTAFTICNLFLSIVKNSNRKSVFMLSVGTLFCITLLISGLRISSKIMINKSVKYKETIEKGSEVLGQLNQVTGYKLYIDDIPYLYMKEQNYINEIIPGIPYRNCADKVVIITDAANEMIHLIKAGYICGKVSDTEYLYTNDTTVASILRESGIDMEYYYAGKYKVDLLEMANANGLTIIDGDKVIIEGTTKSIIHGPWVTVYRGIIKVDYDLDLLDTDISDEEVATLRISSGGGSEIIKEIIVKKSDFDENGHYIASLSNYISDSEGVEFLLFANGETKLKLNSLTYGKVGKE